MVGVELWLQMIRAKLKYSSSILPKSDLELVSVYETQDRIKQI